MTNEPDPYDVLRCAAADAQAYLLGCGESRVTIHSQQVRALNLIWALHATGALEKSVNIVGGGIAGCTAAVAASRLNLEVRIFERQADVMMSQAGCTQRWVHPNLLDWPFGEPFSSETTLPIMSWRTDAVSKVISSLRKQFADETDRNRIELIPSCGDVIAGVDGEVTYGDPHRRVAGADALIYAVGFGKEAATNGYWRTDDLEQYAENKEFVVAGAGDGALADLLRLRLGSSGTTTTFIEWLDRSGEQHLAPFREEVESIERRLAVRLQQIDPHRNLDASAADRFSELCGNLYVQLWKDHPACLAALRVVLQTRLRTDTSVVHIAPRKFDPRASALHRFLLGVLWSPLESGRFDARLSFQKGRSTAKGKYTIGGAEHSELQDRRWVVRSGPKPALELCSPRVYETMKKRRAAYGYTWSRRRLWPKDYFHCSEPSNV